MNAVLMIVVAMSSVLTQLVVMNANASQDTIETVQLVLIKMNAVTELMTVEQMLFAPIPTADTPVFYSYS